MGGNTNPTKGSRMNIRLRAAISALSLCLGVIAPSMPGISQAGAAPVPGTCYGDYCSGMNPATTRGPNGKLCSADGRTVDRFDNFYSDTRFTFELRWSENCKSNWVRWTGPYAPASMKAVQRSTGYTQSRILGGGGTWYSPMIYSPTKCVYGTAGSSSIGYLTTRCL